MTVFDDGTGPALYIGRSVRTLDDAVVNSIARWDGTSWSSLELQANSWVTSLAAIDDGDGPVLYAGGSFMDEGGQFVNSILRWNGSQWSFEEAGPNRLVHALAIFDDGGGLALYVGGEFTTAGERYTNSVAKWDGSAWSALGNGVADPATPWGGAVPTLAVFDDGDAPGLYVGGQFTVASGQSVGRIARWNGTSWSPLGSGVAGRNNAVHALAVFDDGTGPALYAGGSFNTAGGQPASNIARWNGTSWSSLGPGVGGTIYTLTGFDDGTGPALYAGGSLFRAGEQNTKGVARWDGTHWSPMSLESNAEVYALQVYDDGEGPALYAGGLFWNHGGPHVSGFARWSGTSWTSPGAGVSGDEFLYALAVFDDGGGSGPALYAGGLYIDESQQLVARWDGSEWSYLGTGIVRNSSYTTAVLALTVFDDGDGPALYAGGSFGVAGGQTVNHIARWDGSKWTPLGAGIDGDGVVAAMTVFDDGTGPALFAGGSFTSTSGVASSNIAKWQGCSVTPPVCLGDIADDFGFTAADGGGPDGVVDFGDFGDFVALLGLIGPCDGGTPGCLGDIADDFGFTAADGGGPDGQVDFGDFVALLGLIGPCP